MTKYSFEAEISQLLSLIINTFYSQKDVFLRELVSNASDALDKLRHVKLSEGLTTPDESMCISVIPDNKTSMLVINDSGIGMSKDELITNLGTIAHSGTKKFMESLKGAGDTADDVASNLFGQFGMGFYAAFLVSNKVQVMSRRYGSNETFVWESDASTSFTVEQVPNTDDFEHGTRITLFIKEDDTKYLDPYQLKTIVQKHSQFVTYPVKIGKLVQKKVEVDVAEESKESEEGEVTVEDENKKEEFIESLEFEVANDTKPIWMRSDVTDEDHQKFYKATFNEWDGHLAVKKFVTEGTSSFTGLLYIPKHAPFDIFDASRKKKNVKLYVRRVLITEDSDELVPDWLGFVRGIVDSEDLPLNISREVLQKSNIMSVIQKTLIKKTIEMIRDMPEEDIKTFWQTFGKNIKWGVIEDRSNKLKLADLLRFETSKSNGELITLQTYLDRMKENQNKIYYVTGENVENISRAACIEAISAKGYEIVYMTDPIDEYMMQGLRDYNQHAFCCASKDVTIFDSDDSEVSDDIEAFCNKVKDALTAAKRDVVKVRASKHLVKSPCAILTDEYGWTANMERIMKAQALKTTNTFGATSSNKVLELNIAHPLVKDLQSRFDANDRNASDILTLMYDTAMLACGFSLNDPITFSQRMYKILSVNFGLDYEEENGEAEIIDEVENVGGTDGVGDGLEELD